MVLFSAIVSSCLFVALTALFTLPTLMATAHLKILDKNTKNLLTAATPIIGWAVFIFLIFIQTPILGFSTAIFTSITIIIGTVALVWFLEKTALPLTIAALLNNQKYVLGFTLLFLIYCLLNLQLLLPPSDLEALHPGRTANMVAHSLRAGNISLWIAANNEIPVLGQNLFQSTAAATLMVIRGEPAHSQFFLSLLHALTATSLVFSCVIVFLQTVGETISNRAALVIFPVTLVLAHPALSPIYTYIIDTGSSIWLIHSADVAAGMTLLFTGYALASGYSHALSNKTALTFTKCSKLQWACILFMCIGSVFSLTQMGAQFTLILIALLGMKAGLLLLKRSQFAAVLSASIALFALVVSFSASQFGGMLTPKNQIEHPPIYGALTMHKDENSNQFSIKTKSPWINAVSSSDDNDPFKRSLIYQLPSELRNEPVLQTRFFLASLVYAAYPILGFVLYPIVFNLGTDLSLKNQNYVGFISAFIVGLFITSSLSLNGQNWALSRFLLPGLLFGQIYFAACLARGFLKTQLPGRIAIMCICFCVTYPNLRHLNTIAEHSMLLDPTLSRLEAALSFDKQAQGGWPPHGFD